MDLYFVFIASHIVGTILGVGSATFAEIFVIKALKDGVVEPLEGDYLKTIYTVLRIGLIITVVSGFGFLFLYRIEGQEHLIYSAKLWAKLTIVAILLFNAIMLQSRKIPLLWGSAISFTSWYAAVSLGLFRNISAPYFEILAWYVLAVVAVGFVLDKIHNHFGVK